jgi:hypothetical protein
LKRSLIAYASTSKAKKEPIRRALATGNPLAIKMKDPELYLEVVIAGKRFLRIALEVPSRCRNGALRAGNNNRLDVDGTRKRRPGR